MSVSVLDRHVFSKPYFDRQGLIVAAEAGKLLGFVHAGFGPNEDFSAVSPEQGIICVLMVRPEAGGQLANELLARGEAHLRGAGARAIIGGGSYPVSPFYHGLYGGSEISGVLESDQRTAAVFAGHGYREVRRWDVLHRDLARFRPIVDRQQMQIRRHTTFELRVDARPTNWWEACIFEPFEHSLAVLLSRDGGLPSAIAHVWNMETMIGAWGVHAAGVFGLEVTEPRRRQGLATYLLSEAFRHIQAQGVALAEVYVPQDNPQAGAMFRRLGFEQVDTSLLYRKD